MVIMCAVVTRQTFVCSPVVRARHPAGFQALLACARFHLHATMARLLWSENPAIVQRSPSVRVLQVPRSLVQMFPSNSSPVTLDLNPETPFRVKRYRPEAGG